MPKTRSVKALTQRALRRPPASLRYPFGTEFQNQVCFPAPVLQTRSKLWLARKSSYIEIVAPIACPESQDHLQQFMYPTFLDKSCPVNWNLPRLNLDRLPVLDTTKTENL